MKKNDKVNLTIENYGCNAEGVAKVNNQVTFVPYSLLGEKIEATIINDKNKFLLAKIDKINNASTLRVCAPCKYFSKCGGCQLQHTTYQNTLDIKTEIVQKAITNIGKINFQVSPTIGCSLQYNYRNKVALPINPLTRKLGMYRPASHSIIDIDECILQKPLINKLITVFNQYLSTTTNTIYDDKTKKGLLKSLVAREEKNVILITVVINGDRLNDKDKLIALLQNNFDTFGLNLNINKLGNNVILAGKFIHLYGLDKIDLEENNIKYSINNQSFLQVNDEIKNKIYSLVFNEIKDNIVIDAYSGAGLLSAMLCKHSKQVYGIEIIKAATDLANQLKINNNLDNLKNINGDCSIELEKLLSEISYEDKKNTSLIIDPPRKGCDNKVIASIIKFRPKKILYISCNPSTLSRDLNLFIQSNIFKIKFIQPFDMFPQTKHVESITLLELKK